jgi:hypothetical protein
MEDGIQGRRESRRSQEEDEEALSEDTKKFTDIVMKETDAVLAELDAVYEVDGKKAGEYMLQVTEQMPGDVYDADQNPLARAIGLKKKEKYNISFANEFAHNRSRYELERTRAMHGIDGGMEGLLAAKYGNEVKHLFDVGKYNGIFLRSVPLEQLAEKDKMIESLREAQKHMFTKCPKCSYQLSDETFEGTVTTS